MMTANKMSLIDGSAAVGAMASRNAMLAADAALTARYPIGATTYVSARNSTAKTAADEPVGGHSQRGGRRQPDGVPQHRRRPRQVTMHHACGCAQRADQVGATELTETRRGGLVKL